jgi:hypothetical protein
MLLKRHYNIPAGWAPERAPDGTLLNPLPVDHLEVKHTGVHPEQNFSRGLVDAGLAEGWLSMSRGKIIVHTAQEDLGYTVLKVPGTYCCSCDEALGEDQSGETGRRHVAANHAGEKSPDPNNPAGFRVTNAYECVLAKEQHSKWQFGEGTAVPYPYRRASAPTRRRQIKEE